LDAYRGTELYIRAAFCSLAYVLLWGAFALLSWRQVITADLSTWMFAAPLFAASGGFFAWSLLDLDYGDAVFHYGFYVIVTVILRWVAGLNWIWHG
jgi:hypothetical protein